MVKGEFLSTAEIQRFVSRLPPDLQDIALELRNMLASICPEANERILWGALSYHDATKGGPIRGGICQIEPFDVAETAAYVASRMSTAGGVASRVFSREAVTLMHEYSGGIPRTINIVCDNALINGYASEKKVIGEDIIGEVVSDLSKPSDFFWYWFSRESGRNVYYLLFRCIPTYLAGMLLFGIVIFYVVFYGVRLGDR